MGCELLNSPHPIENQKRSYSDLFYEHLPYYLAIGMSWDEYWNDDCQKVKYYRKADELRRKQRNQELWLQGMYVYEAIGDMSPVLRLSLEKKQVSPLPYASEPYPLDKADYEQMKEREEKTKEEKIKAKMMAWAVRANAIKRKEGNNGTRADG